MAEDSEEIAVSEHLGKLPGFDRVVFRFGRLLAATGGVTLRSPNKGGTVTSIDVAFNYLKRVKAHDFESGKSAKQVADATAFKQASMSNALRDLVKRGQVKSEKQGRQIHYYIETRM